MADHQQSEPTVSVYEDVIDILERLHTVDNRLGAPSLQSEPAILTAKKHVMSALQELSALAELLEGIHTRPKEGSRGTTRDVS